MSANGLSTTCKSEKSVMISFSSNNPSLSSIQTGISNSSKFDFVGVTTLFTFYWDITIKTIEFAKTLVKDINRLQVGGVLASIQPEEIYEATGIKPHCGTLHSKGDIDSDNNEIKDNLPLNYSILDEIDYYKVLHKAKKEEQFHTLLTTINNSISIAIGTTNSVRFIPINSPNKLKTLVVIFLVQFLKLESS